MGKRERDVHGVNGGVVENLTMRPAHVHGVREDPLRQVLT